VVPEAIMPPYGFLAETDLKAGDPCGNLTALARVGVPYTDADIEQAEADLRRRPIPMPTPGDLAKALSQGAGARFRRRSRA
jgi:cytochrome c oxidase cbb3-type subunit II